MFVLESDQIPLFTLHCEQEIINYNWIERYRDVIYSKECWKYGLEHSYSDFEFINQI